MPLTIDAHLPDASPLPGRPVRLLLLTYHYPPDLSAGSFRSHALVQALQDRLPKGSELHVLTTRPNRYASFAAEAPDVERHPWGIVRRLPVPAHRSGMADQSLAFLAYARQALRRAQNEHYDLVYATSSKLMTAVLGSVVAHRQGAPLYLDIRDLFVDTLHDALPGRLGRLVAPPLAWLETWAFRRARRINMVSAGFHAYLTRRYPGGTFRCFTNGIDQEFLAAPPSTLHHQEARSPIRVLYAGNIGEGQGLHLVLPHLARALEGRAVFDVIGDGGRRAELERRLGEARCGNVTLHPPLPRRELLEAYRQADILFLHLNDHPAFHKVLPSKLFEYAATGKPIWAGVTGYPRRFIESEIENAAVFPPTVTTAALEAFENLKLEETPRARFRSEFSRDRIMAAMAADLLSVATGG